MRSYSGKLNFSLPYLVDGGDYTKYNSINFGSSASGKFRIRLVVDPSYVGRHIKVKLDSVTYKSAEMPNDLFGILAD